MGDSLVEQQNRTRDEIANTQIKQLTRSLNEMRKAGLNCDCTLEVKGYGREVSSQVHYAVVSAASEYCRSNSICNNGKWTVEKDLGCSLHETETIKEALEQCIEFMYIGKADIRSDTVEYITRLSHTLQLKPLEDMSLETMHGNLTTCDNCFRLLLAARYCEKTEYEAEAMKKWISLNLQQIRGLNECSPENLWRSAADLFPKSFNFNRSCKMLDVLKIIKIEKTDCKFLLDVVMTNKKVTRNSAAAKYVFETICQKINRKPSNLNRESYYKVKNLLARFGSNDTRDLEVRLEKFMINNFDVLAQKKGFLETNQDEVTSIFSSPQLTCTEKIKFDSMVKWVNVKYKPQRDQTFSELFKMLKLENLSREELIDIRKNPMVENNRELMLSVFDALVNKPKTATLQPQHLPVHPDTARWVMDQRPECDNSSNASVSSERSTCRGSSSNTISNFSTASLKESLLSLPTTTDSGADVDGDKADCSLDDGN